jgi:pilus assembly protein Flp/PilA
MSRPRALLTGLASDDSGATAVEYAIMAMVIAMALITVFTTLGTSISNMWNSVATNVTGVM